MSATITLSIIVFVCIIGIIFLVNKNMQLITEKTNLVNEEKNLNKEINNLKSTHKKTTEDLKKSCKKTTNDLKKSHKKATNSLKKSHKKATNSLKKSHKKATNSLKKATNNLKKSCKKTTNNLNKKIKNLETSTDLVYDKKKYKKLLRSLFKKINSDMEKENKKFPVTKARSRLLNSNDYQKLRKFILSFKKITKEFAKISNSATERAKLDYLKDVLNKKIQNDDLHYVAKNNWPAIKNDLKYNYHMRCLLLFIKTIENEIIKTGNKVRNEKLDKEQLNLFSEINTGKPLTDLINDVIDVAADAQITILDYLIKNKVKIELSDADVLVELLGFIMNIGVKIRLNMFMTMDQLIGLIFNFIINESRGGTFGKDLKQIGSILGDPYKGRKTSLTFIKNLFIGEIDEGFQVDSAAPAIKVRYNRNKSDYRNMQRRIQRNKARNIEKQMKERFKYLGFSKNNSLKGNEDVSQFIFAVRIIYDTRKDIMKFFKTISKIDIIKKTPKLNSLLKDIFMKVKGIIKYTDLIVNTPDKYLNNPKYFF